MNPPSSCGALAIFVKTPGLSSIKTRLAAGIGKTAALNWYCAAAEATHAVASAFAAQSDATVYWAVAEDDGVRDSRWSGLPLLTQGAGELGTRMARVHGELVKRHGYGLLIGADAPQLTVADLLTGAQWLRGESARCVLGPAQDGGFWLTGANRALPLSGWNAPRYSSKDTAERFRAAMQSHGEWLTLGALVDVDHAADLPALIAALEDHARTSASALLPAQRALLALCRTLAGNLTCPA